MPSWPWQSRWHKVDRRAASQARTLAGSDERGRYANETLDHVHRMVRPHPGRTMAVPEADPAVVRSEPYPSW